MESKNQTNNNPFVRALRDGAETNPAEASRENSDQAKGADGEVVAATVDAMSLGDNRRQAAPATTAPAATPAAAIPDGGRMEAVVDLLFGNHLTEINASMRALEKQVSERINKAEEEMRVRIDSLGRHTKGEIESLNKALEKERGTREDVVTKMGDRLDTAIQQMEMRMEKMEGEFNRKHEMAQKDLEERLTKANDQTMLLRKQMEQEIGYMKVSMSTRVELGGMFAELGKRLEANSSGSGL